MLIKNKIKKKELFIAKGHSHEISYGNEEYVIGNRKISNFCNKVGKEVG